MSNPRVTLLGSHSDLLIHYFQSHPSSHERAAVILFRRISVDINNFDTSDRYLSTEVITFEENWITSSSSSHISYELKHLRDFFRRCDEESLVFCFAHNHPGGYPNFSQIDDENEITLLRALTNRNGSNIHFLALLWSNNEWKGRLRDGSKPDEPIPLRHISVLNKYVQLYNYNTITQQADDITARQAAAFGKPFVDQLASLRVGVVGAGGTGSPTILLLARSGIGEIIIIDNDKLELSNLNRVRGAGVQDVGSNKAHIMKSSIESFGLATKVAVYDSLIDQDPNAIDALSSCDVIFGCTDDQIGREILNASLYLNSQPLIDVGLGGQIANDHTGQPYLRYHFGRVSSIQPESGECLFCQGVIKDIWIRHQYALRQNPKMAEAESRDRYLEGGNDEAPGVGPFTSAIADYGVATLFDLIKPFRKFPGELRRDNFMIDFVKMDMRSTQEKNDINCPYCKKKEYLVAKQKYRLNRPSLGKLNVCN